jgi:amidohydrolase
MDEYHLLMLRHNLHKNAQVSGMERYAHDTIVEHLRLLHPTHQWSYVGTNESGQAFGVIASWEQSPSAPTIVFRADIDALPINETTALSYCSVHEGASHKCGHDGHTTILLQLADMLDDAFMQGRIGCNVILLWQPEEETGLGSQKMLDAQILQPYNIQAFYAIHNIPGYTLNDVVLIKDTFAAASAGFEIHLHGRQTHASTPEKGRNPGVAVAQLIKEFMSINDMKPNRNQVDEMSLSDFRQSTLICVRLGSEAFGTSAGDAYVANTLRAFTNDSMKQLLNDANEIVRRVAAEQGLEQYVSLREPFFATENNTACVQRVEEVCRDMKRHYVYRQTPFRWSEDCANYLMQWPGAMFGIGSGEQHAELHHPDYDFPDELIQPTAELFINMIFHFCNKHIND